MRTKRALAQSSRFRLPATKSATAAFPRRPHWVILAREPKMSSLYVQLCSYSDQLSVRGVNADGEPLGDRQLTFPFAPVL